MFRATLCALLLRAALPAAAIWGHASFGDAGRSGESSSAGPRLAASSPPGYSHLLHVAWRTPQPSASQFYYGAVDAAGDAYELRTGNGAGAHVLRKLRGADGGELWRSPPPPPPRYANFYGADHLIVGGGAAFVIAGSTYTLADCAWVQALDAATGEQRWLLNGTATVAAALLDEDAGTLFLAFYNGSVSALDAASGTAVAYFDLAAAGVLSNASLAYGMALAEPGSGGGGGGGDPPRLLFSTPGNFSAVSAVDGSVMWRAADPVGAEFTSRPAVPRGGAPSFLFTASGGNYQQGAGYASLALADGAAAWAVPTTDIIGAVGVPTSGGFQWIVSQPGLGTTNSVSIISLASGARLAPPAYFPAFSFSARPVASAKGTCLYLFGSGGGGGGGGAAPASRTALRSFCYDEAAGAIASEYSAVVSGVAAPSGSYALVPAAGRLLLFHDAGVLALEAYELQPAPPPPPPPPPPARGSGEAVALVFGKAAADCLSGGGAVSLTPAAVARAPGGAAEWRLGAAAAATGLALEGQCGAIGAPALDAAGRRAWVLFFCRPPAGGRAVTALAQLDLGRSPGAAPAVAALCVWTAARTAPLFFDARVSAAGPFWLDAGAKFTRSFFGVAVPPAASPAAAAAAAAAAPPPCAQTPLGDLRIGLLPAAALVAADVAGAEPALYFAAASSFGVRVVAVRVPGGTLALDTTLPCDTGLCFDSLRFLAARGAALVAGGSASSPPDWPLATLAQAAADVRTADTLTGLVSQQAPTFPLLLDAAPAVAALADPGGDAARWWLQSLALGTTVCRPAGEAAVLQSVAIVGARAQDAVLSVNTTLPACPLPEGQLCCAVAVAHVEAFTAVA